jgi:hypothetical protein
MKFKALNLQYALYLYCPDPDIFGSHLISLLTYGNYKLSPSFLTFSRSTEVQEITTINQQNVTQRPVLTKSFDIYFKNS